MTEAYFEVRYSRRRGKRRDAGVTTWTEYAESYQEARAYAYDAAADALTASDVEIAVITTIEKIGRAAVAE